MDVSEWQSVSSSNVGAVRYLQNGQEVQVQFLDGSVYAYRGVPEHEFDNLRTASSVGSYLNRNYKNVYPYERIAHG
jgi:KTSC domain